MITLSFTEYDEILSKQKGKIIHQVWFGMMPTKKKAAEMYKKLKQYRDSWIVKNPEWFHVEWTLKMCKELMKKIFPENYNMYKKYKYDIQRCDIIRYFILYRYGGIYADMDYYCNISFDEVFKLYKNDIYFVQTPNNFYNESVSNSLMFSVKKHPFWKRLFIDLELSQTPPIYYSRHLEIMFTTGPSFLTRIYNQYKTEYKLDLFPYQKFHPFGIFDEKLNILRKDIYAVHIGKGSWEKIDSKIFLLFLNSWKIILLIVILLSIQLVIYIVPNT